MLRVYPGQSPETLSSSNPLHSAAQRFCSCVLNRTFHQGTLLVAQQYLIAGMVPPFMLTLHLQHHLLRVPRVFASDSTNSNMTNQEIFSSACSRTRFFSPAPHGWHTAAKLQKQQEAAPSYGKHQQVLFLASVLIWILVLCCTKSVHGHFSHSDKRLFHSFSSSSCPLTQVSKCKAFSLSF